MPLRHIIVEGPDGSGKDTLIFAMMESLGETFALHSRASTSLGGPVPDLAEWTLADVMTMDIQAPSIYNRHPLISEPIYRRYRAKKSTDSPQFDNPAWLNLLKREMARHALIIRCTPPMSFVKFNVDRDPTAHMAGVQANITHIYNDYTQVRWPGETVHYNYTSPTPVSTIVNRCLSLIKDSNFAETEHP